MQRPLILFICFIVSTVTAASHWLPITLHDPILGNRTIYYENRDGDAIVEGDILFRLYDSAQQHASTITRVSGQLWPDGVVPYSISDDLSFDCIFRRILITDSERY